MSVPVVVNVVACISDRRRSACRAAVVVASVAVVALHGAVVPAVSRADGDPASDVLVDQSVFVPWDANAPLGRVTQLESVLGSAARDGYPVRVAIVASASDLGSITALWRQPQMYAEFLGRELSLVYGGRVLVVMPNGFGLYDRGQTPPVGEMAAIARPPTAGSSLVADALGAVTRLSSAAGHVIAVPTAIAVEAPAARELGPDPAEVLIVIGGGVLVALAWTLSLRARPVRFRRSTGPA